VKALIRAWSESIAVTIPVFMILAGLGALILGAQTSRAFEAINADIPIRVVGAAMLLGGILVMYGRVRHDTLWEVAGYSVAAFGAALYGIGALLGLGTYGLITGIVHLGIATQFVRQVRAQWRTARRV
jgi:hypothetical protein